MCDKIDIVRKECKIQAKQFKYNEELLNRFPMWVFRYFAAIDPMCQNTNEFMKVEIITIFMLLNKINADLMMAFYMKGGQSIEDSMKLRNFFTKMWHIHGKNGKEDLIAIFGNKCTFHCQSRSIRRIELSIVDNKRPDGRNNEHFVPDNLEWRRL